MPHNGFRGHLTEVRLREGADDLSWHEFQPAQFSVRFEDADESAGDHAKAGFESRVLPGIAIQATPNSPYELHRLH